MFINKYTKKMSKISTTYDKLTLRTHVFNKICRLCLSEGDIRNILEECHEDNKLTQMLSSCVSIQIIQNDLLPHNMCQVCIDELISTFNFINKCKNSEELLQNVSNESLNLEYKTFLEEIGDANENSKDIYSESDNAAEYNEDYDDTRETRSGQKINKKTVKSKTCTFCELKFDTAHALQAHKREAKHPKLKNRKCDICLKIFSGPYLLKQHMRSHTKEKPYQCEICLACFSNSSNFRRHKKIHTGERPYVCDLCGKAYTQSSILNEHKMTHSGEKPYVCSYCGKSFRAYANYKTHLTRHKIENGEMPKEEQIKEMENYKCKMCDRVLSTKGALKMHMLIHGEKMFLCTHCGKGFVNKGGLRSHSRVHSGERPFACRFCDKMFGLQGSLRQHELIHTGQKPYACKLCPKAFVQHHQLQYHLRTHSGERPYVCSFCGKTFALNGNLKVHIRTHTGETPYHCPICGKGFYDSSSMKKHTKGHGEMNVVDETQMNNIQNL